MNVVIRNVICTAQLNLTRKLNYKDYMQIIECGSLYWMATESKGSLFLVTHLPTNRVKLNGKKSEIGILLRSAGFMLISGSTSIEEAEASFIKVKSDIINSCPGLVKE